MSRLPGNAGLAPNVLGTLLMDIGNLSDAEESQRHANAIFAKLAKAHPN